MTKIIPALCLLLGSSLAQAASCVDIKSCAKAVYDVNGQKYIWSSQMDEIKLSMSPNIELNKDNAELVFTAILDQVGLARAPVGDGITYRILKAAERKELEIPVIEGSATVTPKFPNTWDWVTLRYRPKAKELTDSIERAYRLHVPRESRLQADYNAGLIIVSGTVPVVRQMFETIKAADVPQTPEVKRHFEEQEKKRRLDRKDETFRFTEQGKK